MRACLARCCYIAALAAAAAAAAAACCWCQLLLMLLYCGSVEVFPVAVAHAFAIAILADSWHVEPARAAATASCESAAGALLAPSGAA
eukprot:3341434-Alexandrium_andersonii.AAC.1